MFGLKRVTLERTGANAFDWPGRYFISEQNTEKRTGNHKHRVAGSELKKMFFIYFFAITVSLILSACGVCFALVNLLSVLLVIR